MFEFDIWKVAIGLNETAVKEGIICIVPLAVEAATGKNLPFEISEILYDMIFSTKDWISHQLQNTSRIECEHLFLSSTNESEQVSIDDIGANQQITAQSPQYEGQDMLDSGSENQAQLSSRNSSFMQDTRDLTDSDRSDTTANSENGEFEINGENLDLFFKTEIEI